MERLRLAIVLWNCVRFAEDAGGFRAAIPRTAELADIWLDASRDVLVERGLSEQTADRVMRLRRAGAHEREIDEAARLGARILLPGEAGYPKDLVDHPYAPAPLYVRGRGAARLDESPRIAIVGSRGADRERLTIGEDLGRAAAGAGIPVVSGLARGVDAAAHRGAVSIGAGCLPIGVVGGGIDVVYPHATRNEHAAVLEHGAMLSPFPIGSPPMHWHFPMRNRIVAALARLVVVVSAGERSGSLSTAAAAVACGVEVAAVPGSPLDPLSAGSNLLIKDGALVVTEPRDALEAVLGVGSERVAALGAARFGERRAGAAPPLDPFDARLLDAVAFEPSTAEEIACRLDRPIADVIERLIALELAGHVRVAPGRRYRRVR